jgi:hypothetical protein
VHATRVGPSGPATADPTSSTPTIAAIDFTRRSYSATGISTIWALITPAHQPSPIQVNAMNNDKYRLFLFDNLQDLLLRARRARDDSRNFQETLAAVAFQQGRAMAYYEVISHLVNQLDAFDIDPTSVGLDPSFDPARDLLLQ